MGPQEGGGAGAGAGPGGQGGWTGPFAVGRGSPASGAAASQTVDTFIAVGNVQKEVLLVVLLGVQVGKGSDYLMEPTPRILQEPFFLKPTSPRPLSQQVLVSAAL